MASPLTVSRNEYRLNPKRSDIATPLPVAQFIADLFPNVRTVFDPCFGTGALLQPFKARGCRTIGFEIAQGADFLRYNKPIDCDLVVCNPPFNLGVGKQLGSEVFLYHIQALCGNKPTVLFTPMGFRLNQRKTSKRWRIIRDTFNITSIITLPLDIFDNVLFHCEILIFNASDLQPHYFLPDGVLS